MLELRDKVYERQSVLNIQQTFRFVLFVAGEEVNSNLARKNFASLCDELGGSCLCRVVDVLEDFEAAVEHQILLTPSLLILEPKPGALIVGNLSDLSRVEQVLGIDVRRRKTA